MLIFLFSFPSFSQHTGTEKTVLDTLVTVHFNNRSLKECLLELTGTYAVRFSYIDDEIPLQHPIHCKLVGQPLHVLLDTISKQADIRYFQVGTQIVLKKNEEVIDPVLKDTNLVTPIDTITLDVLIDSVYQSARTTTDGTYLMNKKYRKYFFSVFGKQRIPDSMIVVTSNDTIEGGGTTKKYRYVSRTYADTRFAVGIYGGLGVAYRKLSGDDFYVNERNAEEHSILNYVGGCQLTYYLKSSDVTFRSGLQYMTFGENGTYEEIVLIPPPPSPPGGLPTEKIVDHSYQNRYAYLMLPILAGYRFNVNKYFNISVYSGVSLAFLLQTHSTYENTGYGNQPPPGGFNRNPLMHTYNDVSMVLPLHVEVAYRISNKAELFAAPMFHYFLTSIYSKNDMNSLRPYAFNFSVGLNYFFGK